MAARKISVTHPAPADDSDIDATIIFNERRIGVSQAHIAVHSLAFRRRSPLCDFVITSKVSDSSVLELVKACHGHEYEITAQNVYDILRLCDEMEIETVRMNVMEFLNDHADNVKVAIGGLKYSTEMNVKGSNYEEMIGSRLLEVVSDSEFCSSILECRLEQVIRIIDIWMKRECEKSIPDAIFIFIKQFLDQFGVCGSVVLEKVDIGRLSRNQLKELESMKTVKLTFLNESIFRVLIEFMDLSECQAVTIREQRCVVEQSASDVCELRSRCLRYEEELRRLCDSIEDERKLNRERIDNLNIVDVRDEIEKQRTCLSEMKRMIETEFLRRHEFEVWKRDCGCVTIPWCDQGMAGIFSHLTGIHGGNIVDKNVVSVTGSSCSGDRQHKYALDFGAPNKDRDSCSNSSPGQWLLFDLQDMRVVPTHYAIRSYYNRVGAHHLKSWKVEGSSDGVKWTTLDEQTNNSDLNGPFRIHGFAMKQSCRCKLIRLTSTGKDHNGNNYLVISGFELFGTLLNPSNSFPLT
jgi:hypothetical protein